MHTTTRTLLAIALSATAVIAQPPKTTPHSVHAKHSTHLKPTPYVAIAKGHPYQAIQHESACRLFAQDITQIAPFISAKAETPVTEPVDIEQMMLSDAAGSVEPSDLENGFGIRFGFPSIHFPKEKRWIMFMDLNGNHIIEYTKKPLAEWIGVTFSRGVDSKTGYKIAADLYTHYRQCND